MTDPQTRLQERIAHLERSVEDLSAVVARQDREIDRLTRRVELLMRAEAERQEADGTAPAQADRRPPHW